MMKKVYNRMKTEMQKTGKFSQNVRIILAITGKDILDSVRNKTILSILVTALFLSTFFTIMPQLSDADTPLVFLTDLGDSSYMPLLRRSDALRLRTYPSIDKMKADFIQRADSQLALVLPANFDQTLAAGGIPQIQGYALNWVNSKTITEKKQSLESKLTNILGSPVQIDMNGGTLFMSPESNGGLLEATGIVVILMTTGILLVPNLFLEVKTHPNLASFTSLACKQQPDRHFKNSDRDFLYLHFRYPGRCGERVPRPAVGCGC